jgi:hypothetical protein
MAYLLDHPHPSPSGWERQVKHCHITRQVLWAAAVVIAITGEASAQTTNDVMSRQGATAPFFAVIAKASIPYYRGEHFWVALKTPPAGQFVVNQHLCANYKVMSNGYNVVNIALPGGGSVFATYTKETFILDPANDQKCLAGYLQWDQEQTKAARNFLEQSAARDKLLGDAIRATPPARSTLPGSGGPCPPLPSWACRR